VGCSVSLDTNIPTHNLMGVTGASDDAAPQIVASSYEHADVTRGVEYVPTDLGAM
jgi:hypothetical protein